MKFITLYLALLFLTRGVCAQTDQPNDYLDVTPAELNKRLNHTIHTPHGPIIRMQIFASAIATNRLDLIKVCFLNQYTCGETVKAVAEMPDGDLRQRATIAMLRTPNRMFWPAEQQGMDMHGIPPRLLVEPFISVIPQLLPNVKMNENWLKYQIVRTKLADDMEAVLNSRSAPAQPQQEAQIQKQPAPEGLRTSGASGTSETSPAVRDPSTPNHTGIQNGSGLLTWILGGVILAVLAWWIANRKK
jgi:hypothetical protein